MSDLDYSMDAADPTPETPSTSAIGKRKRIYKAGNRKSSRQAQSSSKDPEVLSCDEGDRNAETTEPPTPPISEIETTTTSLDSPATSEWGQKAESSASTNNAVPVTNVIIPKLRVWSTPSNLKTKGKAPAKAPPVVLPAATWLTKVHWPTVEREISDVYAPVTNGAGSYLAGTVNRLEFQLGERMLIYAGLSGREEGHKKRVALRTLLQELLGAEASYIELFGKGKNNWAAVPVVNEQESQILMNNPYHFHVPTQTFIFFQLPSYQYNPYQGVITHDVTPFNKDAIIQATERRMQELADQHKSKEKWMIYRTEMLKTRTDGQATTLEMLIKLPPGK